MKCSRPLKCSPESASERRAGAAAVAGIRVDGGAGVGLQVVAAGQDGLDRAVVRRAVVEGALAGTLQSRRAVPAGQAEHALCCTQLLQDPIGQQRGDQGLARRADGPGLLQAPVAVVRETARGVRRQVSAHGEALARASGTGVGDDVSRPPRRCP